MAPANQLRLSFTGSEDGEAETETCRVAKPRWRKTTRTSSPLWVLLTEPPYADPHVRWCGRGGAARLPPIPIVAGGGWQSDGPLSRGRPALGGFSFGDTHVGLIVSNPALEPRVVKSPVATSQVAPSILQGLGLEPEGLDAVRQEGTRVLPFLFDGDDSDRH